MTRFPNVNEKAISFFVRFKVSGLIGGSTHHLTNLAQVIFSRQKRHGRLSIHRDICSHVAHYSCRRDPRASGPNLERLEPLAGGPLERTISTGTLGMGMVWAHMSVVMVSLCNWKHGILLGHVVLPVRTLESRFHRHLHDSNLGSNCE